MLSKQIWCAIGYGLLFGVISALVAGLAIGIVYNILGYYEGQYTQVAYAILSAIVLGGMIFGIIYGINEPIREEAKRRREEAERRREEAERRREEAERRHKEEAARLQRHKEEQEGYCKQMVILCEGSLAIFESMPKRLDSAEKWLDQAEADFAEGAFAPFWDSVENAANWLARFDEGVRQIKDKSSHYSELIGKYEDAPPRFFLTPQSVKKLGVGTATAERMKAIVRAAQRNFQFAMIYEQRKTNQILVAGFKTLAEALEQMTRQITASLDALADSVNTSLRAIDSRLDEIAAMSEQHHYEMMEQVSEVAEREREVVEKLDNIQRRR